MLQSSIPPRQQAHDLIDRISPEHLAVAICMLQTMTDAEQAAPRPSAFCDDVFPERDRSGIADKLSGNGHAISTQGLAELHLKTDDTDYWPHERQPALQTHA